MNIYDISDKYERLKKSVIHRSLIQISDKGTVTVEECKEILLFDENTIKTSSKELNISLDQLVSGKPVHPAGPSRGSGYSLLDRLSKS